MAFRSTSEFIFGPFFFNYTPGDTKYGVFHPLYFILLSKWPPFLATLLRRLCVGDLITSSANIFHDHFQLLHCFWLVFFCGTAAANEMGRPVTSQILSLYIQNNLLSAVSTILALSGINVVQHLYHCSFGRHLPRRMAEGSQ